MMTRIVQRSIAIAVCVHVAFGARTEAESRGTRWNPIAALRGALPDVHLSLARLDPDWHKATTPTTTAPPPTPAPTPAPASGGAGDDDHSALGVTIEKCSPFLNMPATFRATKTYWQSECKSVPNRAKYLKLTMGEVTDYFKPKEDKSMCDMLTSGENHMWSDDGKMYHAPTGAGAGLGGSNDGWLTVQKAEDKRDTPSFWGVNLETDPTGGCCHDTYETQNKLWTKPYQMQYCGTPRELAPICTPLTTVAGTFSADKSFWAETCKTIPMTASYVKIAMGDIIDYYRPPTGKTFCEMLTALDSHKWSKDGQHWSVPKYATTGLGGSAADGLDLGSDDKRKQTTFWGSDVQGELGGCCSSSKDDASPSFGKAFTMSFCEVPGAPPTSQLMQTLRDNEKAVQDLEKTMHDLHTKLENAERVNVDAAGNVSIARGGMYKLALKARNEADEVKGITSQSSIYASELDSAETQLEGARKRVTKSANAAKATRLIAEKTASEQALTGQDKLNDKIWALLDPSNKDNLDAVEARVRKMEKAAAKFRTTLKGEIRKVMITKMRRSAGRLRRQLHRLGAAGNKAAARTLGAVEDGDSLGANLGLDED